MHKMGIHMWNPDARLSPREWELSWPIAVVAPEVAVDDKWAVPRDLLAFTLLLIALCHHRTLNLAYVGPPRPISVKEGWMGQMGWPTQSEPEALLLVAA